MQTRVMIHQKSASDQIALQKIRQYCAYQERSHQEVREKLFALGLEKKQAEQALALLIEENFLSEQRFATAFAGGKFRIKQWGRIKIRSELKQKQVSETCIKIALAQIDDQAYESTLNALATKKWKSLAGEKNGFIKKGKLREYLLRKGYEPNRVGEAISALK
jgi:regulatory protein